MSSFAIGTRHAALCADGKVRSAQVTNHPDTFFSVPARVKVNSKTVTGILYIAKEWTGTPQIQFTPDRWRKNARLLPHWLVTAGYHVLVCKDCGHEYTEAGKWPGKDLPLSCVNQKCAWQEVTK